MYGESFVTAPVKALRLRAYSAGRTEAILAKASSRVGGKRDMIIGFSYAQAGHSISPPFKLQIKAKSASADIT
jgi:hypothetical protein